MKSHFDATTSALPEEQSFALRFIPGTNGPRPQKQGMMASFSAEGRIVGTPAGGCPVGLDSAPFSTLEIPLSIATQLVQRRAEGSHAS